ncbi:MAG: YfcC family protein [Oscillospiraceae bacterium]
MEEKKPQTAQDNYGLKIGKKTFISTLLLLFGIMLLAGVLTQIIPQGNYSYLSVEGRQVIQPGTYQVLQNAQRLPVWRWFTAPIEVLFTEKAVTAVMIMLFILLIGGSFSILEKSGILSYIMQSVIKKFGGQKYRLLAVVVFICMLLGSTMGLFEETITLVPITVALSLMLGWDSLVGIGMSILAVGFGFAAGTLNPFTVGVTQKLADLPAFSGVLFRMVFFVVIYGLMLAFLLLYAKKIEKNPEKSMVYRQDEALRLHYRNVLENTEGDTGKKRKATLLFARALFLVFVYIVAAFFVQALSDYSMPVMALLFTLGAFVAGRVAGLAKTAATFFKGLASIAPSVLLILLAMAVTHIMSAGNIIDTILYFFYNRIQHLTPYGGAIVLFLLVLVLEFFISGSAAKAFLLVPIITPLSEMIGITRQTAVQAFILGDGFTNMLYPTSVVLLITLGIANVSYKTWFKWTWKLQVVLLALSAASLLVAVAIGYGPY